MLMTLMRPLVHHPLSPKAAVISSDVSWLIVIVSIQVKMTLLLTAVAVPINTLVGITAAIYIARNEFVGKTLMVAMLDLPFSISPVVTGATSPS